MSPITNFLERKLWALNASHKKIQVPTETDYTSRIREAILRNNQQVQSCSVSIDGQEVNGRDIQELRMTVPEVFKEKGIRYESTAADGSKFSLAICN